MRRIVGILLIIRALSPVLVTLVVIWALGQMITNLREVVATPIANIEAEIQSLEEDIATAQAQFETMKTNITDALSVLQDLDMSDLLPDFPDLITLNGFSIPDLRIPIPTNVDVTWHSASESIDCPYSWPDPRRLLCEAGKLVTTVVRYPTISVTTSNFTIRMPDLPDLPSIPFPSIFTDLAAELGSLFDGFKGIFSTFDPLFASLRTLGTTVQSLPENLQGIVTEGENLLSNLKVLVEKWGILLLVALILIGILIVITFVSPFLDDLGRGLAMVFKAPPTDGDTT